MKKAVDQSNESYFAGKEEYIELVVLTTEHYQSAFVILSIGTFISIFLVLGEMLVATNTNKGNVISESNDPKILEGYLNLKVFKHSDPKRN